ncbi:MAG: hypothetical protein ABI665_10245 [Vicinamibacterales bacterium]
MTRRLGAAITLAMTLALSSCATLAPPKADGPRPVTQRREAMILDGVRVELHVARPGSEGAPLVIFASGDGGWFGAAIGMFDTIAAAGYPVAGLSSRALLRAIRQPGHPLSASRLRESYQEIITASKRAADLPDSTGVILAGWSRGASISVIAGAEPPAMPLAGIVAIGLSADENLNIDLDSDEDTEPGTGGPGGIDTYVLSRAIPSRVAVIQSSGDGYLPADRARILFGGESPSRRFFEVPASNHRFSGGAVTFRLSLTEALNWIAIHEGPPQ